MASATASLVRLPAVLPMIVIRFIVVPAVKAVNSVTELLVFIYGLIAPPIARSVDTDAP
jgi:Na+(H+)/acetate symporter ActP